MSTLTQEELRDFTEERKKRCEPIAKKILQELLNNDLLLSDVKYVEQIVREQLEGVFRAIVLGDINQIMNLVNDSLDEHIKQAQKKLWNGKDADQVSVKQVDEVLKK